MIELQPIGVKASIIEQTGNRFESFQKWVAELDDDAFYTRPVEGKWSAAEQMDHLIKSNSRIAFGLKAPKVVLRLNFGISNRPEFNYEEMVAKYLAKINDGAKSSARFEPEKRLPTRDKLITKWEVERHKTISAVRRGWNEDDLSKYQLPHPILKKITVREMLFFNIFHIEQHLNLLKRDYGIS